MPVVVRHLDLIHTLNSGDSIFLVTSDLYYNMIEKLKRLDLFMVINCKRVLILNHFLINIRPEIDDVVGYIPRSSSRREEQ